MCKCTCVPVVAIDEAPPRPRYNVSASKSTYVSEHYDSLEEAAARLAELAAEGYASVTLRDNEGDDLW